MVPTLPLRYWAREAWWRSSCLGLVFVFLTLPTPVSAHALLHDTYALDSAVLVEFYFPGGDKPFFESYRIMGPDDHRPFQTGRINAAGEVIFRPDRPGPWRVLVATEDGHGAEVRIDVEPGSLSVAGENETVLSQSARVIAGVGYLLGVFGAIGLWRVARAGPRSA